MRKLALTLALVGLATAARADYDVSAPSLLTMEELNSMLSAGGPLPQMLGMLRVKSQMKAGAEFTHDQLAKAIKFSPSAYDDIVISIPQ